MKKKTFYILLPLLLIAFLVGKNIYMAPAYDGGEMAPEVTATLANGDAFQLSSLKGQYVLLDFWGSWCGPCIGEIPAIKALYGKYSKAKFEDANGFTVVSIAVEKREERWRRALKRYQMPWPFQIFDRATSLKFFDAPIATAFGVKQVPTKFLISPNGTIVSVNKSPEEIDAFLNGKMK